MKWQSSQGKPVTVSAATDWKAHFTNLPDKDTVTPSSIPTLGYKEVKVPTHYTVDTKGSQLLTDEKANYHQQVIPETTTVTVKKAPGWCFKTKICLRPFSTLNSWQIFFLNRGASTDLTGEG